MHPLPVPDVRHAAGRERARAPGRPAPRSPGAGSARAGRSRSVRWRKPVRPVTWASGSPAARRRTASRSAAASSGSSRRSPSSTRPRAERSPGELGPEAERLAPRLAPARPRRAPRPPLGQQRPRAPRQPQAPSCSCRLAMRSASTSVVEVPVDHVGEVVHREVDAVVGHPALGKVVGPDLGRAVAGAHHGAALAGARRLLLGDHPVEQPRAQHLHRLELVLQLRFLILLADHEPGRAGG